MPRVKPVIAVHGGAGTIERAYLTPEVERDIETALRRALDAGYERLLASAPAEEGVTVAVGVLEASPLFNAGVGSVLTAEEEVEMDAALMRGADLAAGAVAGIRHVRSPIALARAVMDRSEHVFLIGDGAEQFAFERGFSRVENRYFHTERRLRQLRAVRGRGRTVLDHDAEKLGTVGAVARDRNGDLAAGTSTGGMTNKRFGRVGVTSQKVRALAAPQRG